MLNRYDDLLYRAYEVGHSWAKLDTWTGQLPYGTQPSAANTFERIPRATLKDQRTPNLQVGIYENSGSDCNDDQIRALFSRSGLNHDQINVIASVLNSEIMTLIYPGVFQLLLNRQKGFKPTDHGLSAMSESFNLILTQSENHRITLTLIAAFNSGLTPTQQAPLVSEFKCAFDFSSTGGFANASVLGLRFILPVLQHASNPEDQITLEDGRAISQTALFAERQAMISNAIEAANQESPGAFEPCKDAEHLALEEMHGQLGDVAALRSSIDLASAGSDADSNSTAPGEGSANASQTSKQLAKTAVAICVLTDIALAAVYGSDILGGTASAAPLSAQLAFGFIALAALVMTAFATCTPAREAYAHQFQAHYGPQRPLNHHFPISAAKTPAPTPQSKQQSPENPSSAPTAGASAGSGGG